MTKILCTTVTKQEKQSPSKASGRRKSRAAQRRRMAALRMACRVLGIGRKRLALGFTGFTSVAGVALVPGLLHAAVVSAGAEVAMPAVTQTHVVTLASMDIDALIERLNQILGINIADGFPGGTSLSEALQNISQQQDAVNGQISNLFSNAVMYEGFDHGVITFNGIGGTLLRNIRAGAVSANSSEAINGLQLYTANRNVASALGGGATVSANGDLAPPTYKIQNADYTNVGGAFDAVNTGLDTISGNITALQNIAVIYSADRKTISLAGEGGTKITNVADGDVSVTSRDAVNGSQLKGLQDQIDGLEAGADPLAVRYDGEDRGTVTFNENGGSTRLTNVAAGAVTAASTDAVNGSQLYTANRNVASVLGGGAGIDANGNLTQPVYTIQNIAYTSIGTAFAGVNTSLGTMRANLDMVTGTVTTLHDMAVIYSANKTMISLLGDSGTKITNVADGDVSENSKEAVNGGQLKSLQDQIADIETGADPLAVRYDEDIDRKKITLAGQNGTTLANVAAGAVTGTSTDAVNGSQLRATNDSLASVLGGTSAVDANGNITRLEYSLQGGTYHTVGSALGILDTGLTDLASKAVIYNADRTMISLLGDNGTKITNVADGDVSENSKEAVNGGQLKSLQDQIADIETGADPLAVRYDDGGKDIVTFNKSGDAAKLTNVAAGAVSQTSTDVINGSQLYTANRNVAAALGGGAMVDANGNLMAPDYTIQMKSYQNVGDALGAVDTGMTTISGNLADLTDRAVVYDGRSGDTKDKITFAGDGGTTLANVKDGTVTAGSKEAVNGGQLYAVKQEIDNVVDGKLQDGALLWDEEEEAYIARHKGKTQAATDGKAKISNLADGDIIAGASDAATSGQLYASYQAMGQSLGAGAGWNNGSWTGPNFTFQTVDGGKVVGGTADNVQDALSRLGKGIADVNDRVDTIANGGGSADGGPYLEWKDDGHGGGYWDAGGGRIGAVGNGEIAAGSRDAVNGGQLWENNKDLNDRLDGINDRIDSIGNIENVENAVQYDVDENGDKTGKITLKGSDEGAPVVIDNVGDGRIETGSKEAVNGGQIHDYVQLQRQEIIAEANNYTDMRFNQLNSSLRDVRKEARQAAAIGLAAASLRYNDDPGKLSVAFGSGWWQSESAMAFGVGYTSESGKFRSNLSATSAGGDWGVGAGLSITLN
ncbi:MAG: Trimeric autotransporter adhesin TAA [Candidatus Tokpelaia hoelldobleri]|uniref:Trimeric autotransporter adhesin TAA n=2 Tax=cellular organisms TaxID=131567 RepID=A0A1U9JSL2_9HYPH|nr:MAG: Trimeric autotransporter adhesin TAA [Candidatus Tokpelaia hoelldoblerii]